jgi:riboflavin kinase/FMN adenylyltransferase
VRIVPWSERSRFIADGKGYAMAVGVFDGVHRGHAEILGKVISVSSEIEAVPACFTFSSNPKRRLAPDRFSGDILALEDKLGFLASSGMATCFLADFDEEFASMEGIDFLKKLRAPLGARALVLGENSRFGRGASLRSHEAAVIARSLGMRADIMPSLKIADAIVSSSAIREAILSGRLDEAGEFLGRPFSIQLTSFDAMRLSVDAFALADRGGLVLPPAGAYRALAFGEEGGRSPVEAIIETGKGGKRIVLKSPTLPHTLEFV